MAYYQKTLEVVGAAAIKKANNQEVQSRKAAITKKIETQRSTVQLRCAMSAFGQSGKHMLALSFSGFDPYRTSRLQGGCWILADCPWLYGSRLKRPTP